MIKLVRVDHRLLHGQVAFSWTNSIQADCILVASDVVVNDEIWKTTLRLGKPSGVKLVIKDIQASIEAINSGVTDKYQLLIVVQTITDAYILANACPSIQSINLGGTKVVEDGIQVAKQIFATSKEADYLNELMDRGVEIEVRQLANETKQIITTKIKK